jgi:hypothetical protein
MISTRPNRILVSDQLDQLLHEVARIRIAKRAEIRRKIIKSSLPHKPEKETGKGDMTLFRDT